MTDQPALLIAAIVWGYWFCVGVMIVRTRRRRRKLAGIVPEQSLERFMWVVFVPLVAAWCALPYLAATRGQAPWAVAAAWRADPYQLVRWVAVALGLVALAMSIACWRRMGRNWSMAVTTHADTKLVTTGLYERVRHPIYALSIGLMLCTLLVVPTWPMLVVAVIHFVQMVTKALNEERFLHERMGASYADYCAATGRFLPRFTPR
jgi:protein-S-isoprenylcysteine O-methyltransferase Ste14